MKINQQSLTHYRITVAIRCLIASVGGYTLAALSNIFLSTYLPLTRSEAVITANMLALLIFCAVVCWVFSLANNYKALFVILVPCLLLALLNNLQLLEIAL